MKMLSHCRSKQSLALSWRLLSSAAENHASATRVAGRAFSTFEISPTTPQVQYASVNPTTGRIVGGPYEFASASATESSLEFAAESFRGNASMAERAQKLEAAAGILRDQVDHFAGLITMEMGKPINASKGEVLKCADVLSYYAKHGADQLKGYSVETDASKSYVTYQPIGTVFAVMPWNFPFWQVFRFAAPALMAGNTAIVKHAPNVPQCAIAIEQVFSEAGFGQAFQNMFYDIPTASKVIADDRIAAVTLTGSNRAGESVAAAAGKSLKKTVLELGGSDPFIVLNDADMDMTIAAAVTSRMMNGGQSCISAKRFIVMRDVAQEFSEKLAKAFSELTVGDPMDPKTAIGPMARLDLRTQLHDQVTRSVRDGAQILLGGQEMDGNGFFYAPTVMRCSPNVAAFKEELFGPVAPIFDAEDEQHAIALANQTEFGLGGSVFTSNISKGEEIASRLECGMAFVNGFVKSDPRLPFGGIKKSGYGRECASEGIKEFVNIKTMWIA